jgi:hypothetical protein
VITATDRERPSRQRAGPHRVSHSQRAYPGLEAKTATRAVNALRDAGLIEQRGRGDWQVTDPLLRRYLTEL